MGKRYARCFKVLRGTSNLAELGGEGRWKKGCKLLPSRCCGVVQT